MSSEQTVDMCGLQIVPPGHQLATRAGFDLGSNSAIQHPADHVTDLASYGITNSRQRLRRDDDPHVDIPELPDILEESEVQRLDEVMVASFGETWIHRGASEVARATSLAQYVLAVDTCSDWLQE